MVVSVVPCGVSMSLPCLHFHRQVLSRALVKEQEGPFGLVLASHLRRGEEAQLCCGRVLSVVLLVVLACLAAKRILLVLVSELVLPASRSCQADVEQLSWRGSERIDHRTDFDPCLHSRLHTSL